MKRIKLLVFVSFLFIISFVRAQEVDIFSLPGGEISATHAENIINRLIDNKVETNYEFDGLSNLIVYKAPSTYVIKKLVLTSSSLSSEKDPKNMELAGSHDGVNWEVIRNQSNYTFTERKQTRTISVSSNQAYSYFRLKITAVNLDGSKKGAIAEWRLLGEERILSKAPSDARANPLASNEVRVSWRDLANDEDNYLLQRTADGKKYKTIATLPENTTSYVDNDVYLGALYIYRVCSVKDKMKSAYSVSNTVEIPIPPILTSLTAGYPYTASEQRNNSPEGESVASAFDDDVTTKYLTKSSTTWVQVDFEEAFKVEQYSITSANDDTSRDPKNWTLNASNDGTNWEVLDTRTNELFDLRFQKRFFEINNDKAYKHYRLNITKNNGASNTQLADWLLYADVPVVSGQVTPETPTDFNIEVRTGYHVKLSWKDVQNETGYLIERSEDGGKTFTYTYEIPANNTESYPYSLKPETNYVFKLYAVSGDKKSSPVSVSATTPDNKFAEKFENYKVWVHDKAENFIKVEQIGNTAFYLPDRYTKNDIHENYYKFYAANWSYVFQCYGEELSDPRLHVLLIPEGGGGLASIFDYRSAGAGYTNMVYIKANASWFKNYGESGYAYDVMSHELCHIIEGVGGGYNLSVYYPVWGDSKWAEILQYDIFKALGSPRAESWHNAYMNGGGPGYPTEDRINYWYSRFFYPTYAAYGKTEVLKRFWKLQKEHYRMKNGNFQGSAENPGGRGNLGELIHFWSGACGVDIKSHAIAAFGWNDQYEVWLQKAKIDYPGVSYADAPIESGSKNICQNGGELQSNVTFTDINRFIDNDYSTYLVVRKNDIESFCLTYTSPVWTMLKNYNLIFQDGALPASWTLSASSDGKEWVVLDTQNNPTFSSVASNKNKFEGTIQQQYVYKQYKLDFNFKEENQIKLVEVELFGTEFISAPNDLRAKKLTDESVYVDWSCLMDEVESYELERSNNGTDFVKIADVSRNEISYTDDLSEAGGYYYRVATINKNAEKAKIYSNVAYVNTTVDYLNEHLVSGKSFYEFAAQLSHYPNNIVSVYSVTGSKVFHRNYTSNDLLPYLNSCLKEGIYIVTINSGEVNDLPVSEKIIIR